MDLAREVRTLTRRKMTREVESLLHDKRSKLQKLIDDFHRDASIFLRKISKISDGHVKSLDDQDDWKDVEEGDDPEDIPGAFPSGGSEPVIDLTNATLPAEKQPLRLPSSFGKEVCSGVLEVEASVERDIRKGQANDALHGLQLGIGEKSFAYRKKIRQGGKNPNTGYAARTRSNAEVRTIQRSIDQFARVYTSARKALCVLGATDEDLEIYRVLTPSDIAASTAVIDFNARGERGKELSWIWQRHVSSTDDPEWMNECEFTSVLCYGFNFGLKSMHYIVYRVNWLRAKCRKDRWAEELELATSELEWTKLYHHNRAQKWRERSLLAQDELVGLRFYALRQAKTWELLESQAQNALNSIAKISTTRSARS